MSVLNKVNYKYTVRLVYIVNKSIRRWRLNKELTRREPYRITTGVIKTGASR